MAVKLHEGFNADVDNQDYHDEREHISSSGLKLFLKSPRSFYEQYIKGDKPEGKKNNTALDFGSYLHCVILEPHLLDIEFAVYDGAQRRGTRWEKFKEENEGKTLITGSQKAQADVLVRQFNEAKVAIGKQGIDKEVPISSFFKGGFAEQTLCGSIDGVKIKVRFDYRKEFEDFGSINDIKTTSEYIDTASQAEAVCAQWGYDVSAALYVDLVSNHTGKQHDFYFCFLSKRNGAVKMYKASDQMLDEGRKKYMEAIGLINEARKTGLYYTNKIEEIDSVG